MRPCECILNVKLTLIFFQGEDSIDYFLGLTPSGIIVLRNRTKVSDASDDPIIRSQAAHFKYFCAHSLNILLLDNVFVLSQVGNYFWPRISKIYFKGIYFMLRVRDKTVSIYSENQFQLAVLFSVQARPAGPFAF